MKPRKASDLRELSKDELVRSLEESRETLAKNRFQHALSQLQDTSYLKTLRKDIARIETILSEEQTPVRRLTRKKRKNAQRINNSAYGKNSVNYQSMDNTNGRFKNK